MLQTIITGWQSLIPIEPVTKFEIQSCFLTVHRLLRVPTCPIDSLRNNWREISINLPTFARLFRKMKCYNIGSWL